MEREHPGILRCVIHIYGIVQGVGFRPYVYREACRHNLNGWVNNSGSGVTIDIEGSRQDVKSFLASITETPPILSRIEKVEVSYMPYKGYNGFIILDSDNKSGHPVFISPDIAVCEKCIKEVASSISRRHLYPFTNCTDCGPRYSIIRNLPYDRSNTTMKVFQMCRHCQSEYDDPSSRRFHAEPNCCSNCGPRIIMLDRNGTEINVPDPVAITIQKIKSGAIVAIKGIGGYHLCCDALNRQAIELLRQRKRRLHKPFAVMVKDMDTIRSICHVDSAEESVLTGVRKPIVLLKKKEQCPLPDSIAPRLKKLGVMLPYTPLHYLLFQDGLSVLVMTSGNISGYPIQYKDQEAIQHLMGVADYFLIHNREINMPVDDSVVRVVHGHEMVSRCGRGYAPYPVPMEVQDDVLAFGAEEKGSFCLIYKGYAHLSQYLGDLKNFDDYLTYRYVMDNFMKIFKAQPSVMAYDLHTGYISTGYAKSFDGTHIAIQHHHAHMVSCMAEYQLKDEVIGVIFDGTGLGTDGTIWGGEFLVGSRTGFERVGHLEYVSIQGGDCVSKEPWRSAAGYLFSMGADVKEHIKDVEEERVDFVIQALGKGLNCHNYSSMGRLFDCVAVLVGLCPVITYSAQAAIWLESLIDQHIHDHYDYEIFENDLRFVVGYKRLLKGIIEDLRKMVPASVIAAKFHNSITLMAVECVNRISARFGLKDVVLSGGVFENEYLLKSLYGSLIDMGFSVFYNRHIPINDGGISLGQAVVAGACKKEGT